MKDSNEIETASIDTTTTIFRKRIERSSLNTGSHGVHHLAMFRVGPDHFEVYGSTEGNTVMSGCTYDSEVFIDYTPFDSEFSGVVPVDELLRVLGSIGGPIRVEFRGSNDTIREMKVDDYVLPVYPTEEYEFFTPPDFWSRFTDGRYHNASGTSTELWAEFAPRDVIPKLDFLADWDSPQYVMESKEDDIRIGTATDNKSIELNAKVQGMFEKKVPPMFGELLRAYEGRVIQLQTHMDEAAPVLVKEEPHVNWTERHLIGAIRDA